MVLILGNLYFKLFNFFSFCSVSNFFLIYFRYWYFAIGFPAVLGVNMLPFLFASLETLKYREVFKTQRFLLFVMLYVIGVYR